MRRGRTDPLRILLALLALAGTGCDVLGPDDTEGPGSLTATLVSPNGDEGSAVLELTGGSELGTVSPLGGDVFYEHGPAATRIVVILDEPGAVRFQVRTEDVGTLPAVSVIQVADGMNRLRGSLSGYQVRFTREKDPSRRGSGGS